jgi:hypothetical protein
VGKEVGRCRLCGQSRELVEAHVIPRAFWPLGEGTPKALTNTPGIYPARMPQGAYDPSILCGECDTNILGPVDQHAAETLLRGIGKPLTHGPLAIREYPDADPVKIALFAASIAWRASISNHRFYSRIRLGRYEDVIRRMILGTPTEAGTVEVAIAEFDAVQGILDPHQTRFEGVRFNLYDCGKACATISVSAECSGRAPSDPRKIDVQDVVGVILARVSDDRHWHLRVRRGPPDEAGLRMSQ